MILVIYIQFNLYFWPPFCDAITTLLIGLQLHTELLVLLTHPTPFTSFTVYMVKFSLSGSERDHNPTQVSPWLSPQERGDQIELSTMSTLITVVHLLIFALKETFLNSGKIKRKTHNILHTQLF